MELTPRTEISERFKKLSIAALLGLTIVTLTFYWAFWLRRNTRVLNEIESTGPIPVWFFPVILVLTSLNFGWSIFEILSNDDRTILLMGKILGKVDLIVTWIWIFLIRGKLNNLFLNNPLRVKPLHPIWTFIFGIFYLQFRLNRISPESTNGSVKVFL